MENLSFNPANLSFQPIRITDICLEGNQYSPDCLVKWFCPQISHYFVNMALSLIILYVLFSWLLWAYWAYIHDKIQWEALVASKPFITVLLGGNPRAFETKVRVELWIRDKLEKLMLGFLVIFWWFYR